MTAAYLYGWKQLYADRYPYVGGVLVNRAQFSGGYGREYTYQHQRYKYRDVFLAKQATAKTQGARCGVSADTRVCGQAN